MNEQDTLLKGPYQRWECLSCGHAFKERGYKSPEGEWERACIICGHECIVIDKQALDVSVPSGRQGSKDESNQGDRITL